MLYFGRYSCEKLWKAKKRKVYPSAFPVPDEPPADITAKGTEPTVLRVHWSPVPDEDINGIIIGYKLALFNTSGENMRNYTLNASLLSLEITGLEIWTNHSIRMVAFTVVGEGPWSNFIRGTTDEEGEPQDTQSSLQLRLSSNSLMIVSFSFLFVNSSVQISSKFDRTSQKLHFNFCSVEFSCSTKSSGNSPRLHGLLRRSAKFRSSKRVEKRLSWHLCYWRWAYRLIQVYWVSYLGNIVHNQGGFAE